LRSKAVVAVAASVLAMGGVYAAAAAIGSEPDGVLHGCYDKHGGALRLIDPSSEHCKHNERPISWNVKGVAGDPGPAGAGGDVGPAGPSGGPAAPQVIGRAEIDGSAPLDLYSLQAGARRRAPGEGGGPRGTGTTPGLAEVVITVGNTRDLEKLGLDSLTSQDGATGVVPHFAITLNDPSVPGGQAEILGFPEGAAVVGFSTSGSTDPALPPLVTLTLEANVITVLGSGGRTDYDDRIRHGSTSCHPITALTFVNVARAPTTVLQPGETAITAFDSNVSRNVTGSGPDWILGQIGLGGPVPPSVGCLFYAMGFGSPIPIEIRSLAPGGVVDLDYSLTNALIVDWTVTTGSDGKVKQTLSLAYTAVDVTR
jgi:hypothetical protein